MVTLEEPVVKGPLIISMSAHFLMFCSIKCFLAAKGTLPMRVPNSVSAVHVKCEFIWEDLTG